MHACSSRLPPIWPKFSSEDRSRRMHSGPICAHRPARFHDEPDVRKAGTRATATGRQSRSVIGLPVMPTKDCRILATLTSRWIFQIARTATPGQARTESRSTARRRREPPRRASSLVAKRNGYRTPEPGVGRFDSCREDTGA
jgi:hypothetical protein